MDSLAITISVLDSKKSYVTMYINGKICDYETIIGSSTATAINSIIPNKLNSTVTRTGLIGSNEAADGHFFNGKAFDIFMFDRGLSQSEIINIMNHGQHSQTFPVHNWINRVIYKNETNKTIDDRLSVSRTNQSLVKRPALQLSYPYELNDRIDTSYALRGGPKVTDDSNTDNTNTDSNRSESIKDIDFYQFEPSKTFGTNGVTISLWFNSKDNGHLNPFRPDVHLLHLSKTYDEYDMTAGQSDKDGDIAIYFKDDSGLLHVKYGISGNATKETGLHSHLHNNKWYHLGVTISSEGKIMICIDGILMKEKITGTPLPSDPVTGVEPTRNYGLAGKSHASSTGMFKGYVFDVFMFDKVLTSTELNSVKDYGIYWKDFPHDNKIVHTLSNNSINDLSSRVNSFFDYKLATGYSTNYLDRQPQIINENMIHKLNVLSSDDIQGKLTFATWINIPKFETYNDVSGNKYHMNTASNYSIFTTWDRSSSKTYPNDITYKVTLGYEIKSKHILKFIKIPGQIAKNHIMLN